MAALAPRDAFKVGPELEGRLAGVLPGSLTLCGMCTYR